VLGSAQNLGHQKADRISIPEVTVLASKLWSAWHDRAPKCIFAEIDHVWAPIGIGGIFLFLRHPFQSHFCGSTQNFVFSGAGDELVAIMTRWHRTSPI
jgi:hypothetical protein